MKFPKSMHAEGWANHFDEAPAPVKTHNPALKRGFKAGAKPVTAHTPLHGDAQPHTAAPATPAVAVRPAASPAPRSSSVPWVVGAGVGVLLMGGAVLMSRNTIPAEPATPVVVGQVTPSAEDAQLQAAPPATGVVTPAPEAAAVTEAPAAKPVDPVPAPKPTPVPSTPPVAVAAAPAAKLQAPAPDPVVRTLTPQPQALAQVSPPPVANPPAATEAPALPPVVVAPVTPPLAQQAPAVPDPVDTGITIQVRQALAADATLAAVPIAVSTDHGVVKLEGQAPDAQVRDRATVVAASTVGVKSVDNRLTLPPVASLDRAAISNGG